MATKIPAQEMARFVKLISLSASPQDAEALTALRKATSIMDKHRVSWPEMLHYEFGGDETKEAFSFLLGCELFTVATKDMLRSFHQYYIKTGKLSEKQRAVFDKLLGQAGWKA